jgi:2-polyprenyl-3-methyl-5-hydroxy-6-metoxy-1,4-benzoquinol methylase
MLRMELSSADATTARFQNVCCNNCGKDETTPFLEDTDYAFVRCQNCGLVYQDPQPVLGELRERYNQEYFEYEFDNEANFFNLMLLGMKDIGFDPAAWQSSDATSTTRTFLDIGCATGRLLQHMRENGWSVRGVDLTPESAAYGREHRDLDIFAGTLEEAALPTHSQSVIHFSHLIEHVPNPKSFLQEVARVLEPGGLVLVTTPNVRGFQARLFGNQWRQAIADHTYLFDKKTIRQSLLDAGLTPTNLRTWGGLAAGTAPKWLKLPADKLAKHMGFGDVMMISAQSSPTP